MIIGKKLITLIFRHTVSVLSKEFMMTKQLFQRDTLKDILQDIKVDKKNKEIRYDLTELQRTTRKKNKINKANIAEYRESL